MDISSRITGGYAVISVVFGLLGCEQTPSEAIAQVGQPSGAVLCLPSPDRCAEEGTVTCAGSGVRTCREIGGCLTWGAPVSCPPNETCGEGVCRPACPEATCDTPEARRCAPGDARALERCADSDGDGCFGWEADGTCENEAICNQGRCGGTCTDECAAGFVRCEGDAVVSCSDHDKDGCLEWGGKTTCEASCALGACVATCVNECAAEGLTRCDGAGVETCREVDGCFRWVASLTCPEGTTCSSGRCSAECENECQEGERTCEAGGSLVCGQFDGDACRDWSLPVQCAAGETCSAGSCSSMCEDECTAEGATDCDSSGHAVVRCGQYDADPCLEFAEVAACAASETCSLGECRTECVDECTAGSRQCRIGSASEVEVCANSDHDPCLEWTLDTDCAANGMVCANGACASQCADECSGATCDGNASVPCGDFDGDTCKDRGTPLACKTTESCNAGVCSPLSPPTGVKISELLYRSSGPDEDVYIELSGPPGTSLAGAELVAVNGSDGQTYGRLTLTGGLDSSGLFVVAHPLAEPSIFDWADQLSTFADLQNGPDNLLLKWGDTTLDAVGYGVFSGRDAFRGEGSASAATEDDESLARVFRDGVAVDTDNNSADFIVTLPTPGTPWVESNAPTEGDIVITELMIDANVQSDNLGEWVELWNPSPTKSFDLSGCLLESDMNEAWTFPEAFVIGPLDHAVVARSANPGFVPDAVWTSVSLSNDGDALAVTCGGAFIDMMTWDQDQVRSGKSLSLDPSFGDAGFNDFLDAWCTAPVEAASGRDAGTPGAPNPPCEASVGTYDATTFDSTWGSCNAAPDWREFSLQAAPLAVEDGKIVLEWSVMACASNTPSELAIEIAQGDQWVRVGTTTRTATDVACGYKTETFNVSKSILNTARRTTGRIDGRLKITSNCPTGATCTTAEPGQPYNCARAVNLSYAF